MKNKIGRTARGLAVAAAAGAVLFSAAARGDVITHGGTTITMDFVNIGDAGNTPDDTGYGAVAYPYRIGTYEVSQAQWSPVNTAAGIGDVGGPWTGSQPVADISWHNAALFCNWLTSGSGTTGYYTITGSGDTATAAPNALSHAAYAAANGTTYFLPTEDEWYKAAYYAPNKPGGAGYYDYPTESDTMPGAVASGTTAGTAVYGGGAVTATADVTLSGGLSPYLTMGQGGNVYEWNETLDGGKRGLRGGTFNWIVSDLHSFTRNSYVPSYEFGTVGFRVASTIPEPGSLGLLTIALAGTAARRKRLAR